MHTTKFLSGLCRTLGTAALLAFFFSPAEVFAQADVSTTTISGEGVATEEITTVTVTVTAVDLNTRSVTVKEADGAETTMTVGADVKRLDEVKVGDLLNIGYLQSVGLEFRAPTPEEMKEPFMVIDETERAGKEEAPAGGKARTIRAVVTVEGMSRWLNTLTVKGPRGNYFIVEVEPGQLKWEDLRIGQSMVGTYTEAMVMVLEPAPKK
ncbi:MAG: hypothetical protein JNL43_12255 [Flavobacteriales bacterium]|nr:hypothetical protein [Flavobacteriales bacterium]